MIQRKSATYKLSTACMDINKAGTLNVSKNIQEKYITLKVRNTLIESCTNQNNFLKKSNTGKAAFQAVTSKLSLMKMSSI